jgi:hypothetical protein
MASNAIMHLFDRLRFLLRLPPSAHFTLPKPSEGPSPGGFCISSNVSRQLDIWRTVKCAVHCAGQQGRHYGCNVLMLMRPDGAISNIYTASLSLQGLCRSSAVLSRSVLLCAVPCRAASRCWLNHAVCCAGQQGHHDLRGGA